MRIFDFCKKILLKNIHVLIGILFFAVAYMPLHSFAQIRGLQGAAGRVGNFGRGATSGKADSLQHRTGMEDSITIKFRYFDSSKMTVFDSSIIDFTRRVPQKWTQINLGNSGTATEERFFSPLYKAGWDHGFHSFDVYNFTLEQTRFYNTTRPYTELNYLLGSVSEQMIGILHTQNIKPNWNAAFQYRLINSPGTFQNQNSNHNNYRFTSWYQSPNKRYQNFLVLLGNKLMVGENGGIKTDENYLDSSSYLDNRFVIPTKIGATSSGARNFFTTNIPTGSYYTNATYLFRQQYDLGQKDSIEVNDSTTIRLFYPRLRWEHTISYNTYNYRFTDIAADSAYYKNTFNIDVASGTTKVFRRDMWKELLNDVSIYQFPDAKNSLQFFKVGASFQTLQGNFDTGLVTKSFTNIWLHGEYRNKTRNKKWDIFAKGAFYLSGFNSGDYNAQVNLKRLVSDKFGYVTLAFENVNRTPSYIFEGASSFYLSSTVQTFNKENHTKFYAAIDRPKKRLKLFAQYQLLNNYTYFKNYFEAAQATGLFTVLQAGVEKDFKLGKKGWHWRTWILLQQKAGNAEVNLPLISTRNQFAYDGNLGYKNLNLSAGLEFRYFTAYKANNYSPVLGQFFYQNTETIKMRLPEVTGFVHFRIRSFTSYIRFENLNALNPATGTFTKNNILLGSYPSPGMLIKIGVFWSFVN